jgi:hypothetical protein
VIDCSQVLTTAPLSRSRLVRLTLGGGAALIAGSAAAPASAGAAAAPPEGDLATVRLLASGELLAQAFYTSAISSKRLSKAEVTQLERALDEQDHYAALAKVLGVTAPVADFEFAFPNEAFTRRGRMLRTGAAIETALSGASAGAAATASTLELRGLLAQIAVSDAQHVALLNRMRGGAATPSFPELFDVEQASVALGPFFGE